MKFLFTRHGQTDWNLEGKLQGNQDIELNQTGIKQAEMLAEKLSEGRIPIQKIYTSTKLRAYQTGMVISEKVHCPCYRLEGIEEMNFGEWEGLTWEEIQKKFPDNYREWQVGRRYIKTKGGESCQEVLERVLPVLQRLADTEEGTVLVVTHGAVLMILQCYLKNTAFENMWDYLLDNGTVLEIEDKEILNA